MNRRLSHCTLLSLLLCLALCCGCGAQPAGLSHEDYMENTRDEISGIGGYVNAAALPVVNAPQKAENESESAADDTQPGGDTQPAGEPQSDRQPEEDPRAAVLGRYENLGVARVKSYLNVREKPESKGKVVGKMLNNYGCEIVEDLGDWYRINSGSLKNVYVSKEFIVTGEEAKQIALSKAELMIEVTTEVLNVRKEPTTQSGIWTQIAMGQLYEIRETDSEWIEVVIDEETSGFVSSEFVDVGYMLPEALEFTEAEGNSLRAQIVNYAMRFLWNPYVWGGTNLEKGVDCSGFVMKVYEHFGIKLPHYSVSQSQMGRSIKSSEMQLGDLVFYSTYKAGISHVAIYIGNGKVVQAYDSNKGIIITKWNYITPLKIFTLLDD